MASKSSAPSEPLGGLALLSWLRPPAGYVTDAALGTTYSLDLITCAAALTSLEGTAQDTADFRMTAALRAMQRLQGRVHIVAQQGCVYVPEKTKSSILPLLDRFVRQVRFSLAERAFHPKVWVVRQRRIRSPGQEDGEDEIRYVLVVGSRNLTRDLSWDLGVGIEGVVGGARGATLHGVRDFVGLACQLGDLESFAEYFSDVGDVSWTLPARVTRVEFGFHGQAEVRWPETELAALTHAAEKVLWISPFLDKDAVCMAAAQGRDTSERRLVAGTRDLDAVAHKLAPGVLERLMPRAMAPASDVPSQDSQEDERSSARDEDAEIHEDARGLHAKVVAVWHRGHRKASVLIGSPNLTRRGWLGANVEAWICLHGKAALADALWAWSSQVAAEYHPPRKLHEEAEAAQKTLDRWHHRIAALEFRLHEHGPVHPARLMTDAPPIPENAQGVELRIERFTRPGTSRTWPTGLCDVTLAGCADSEWSDLVVFELRVIMDSEEQRRRWLQPVRVEPAIDYEARDGSLLRRVLSPDDFLAYLRGLLDPVAADVLDEFSDEPGASGHNAAGSAPARTNGMDVETLLRALARAGDPDRQIDELERSLAAYMQHAATRDTRLDDLQALVRAVREAYGR